MKTEKFYDGVSSFYDDMISFESNLARREDFYKKIFNARGKTADLGCGSGLDSIALAKSGFDVTAFDPSEKMIESLNRKAELYGLDIESRKCRMENIPAEFDGSFDYAVSMGNTITHLNKKNLKEGIKRAYEILKPRGIFFLHQLNYDYFIKNSIRINSIKTGARIIVRFYDFSRKKARFNILEFAPEKPKDYRLYSVTHYIHNHEEIKAVLFKAGFNEIAFYADMNLTPFEREFSKEMFILCRK
ncbi:class I SAM-dependent methyltransferase [Melioribacter sp. Ez-97]|uniref:class I SAM-dependent methyltransferase n=1 Tax=Melioribacter sp. Ez-97 TaxID=3423434 RepID=UPI003EDB6960